MTTLEADPAAAELSTVYGAPPVADIKYVVVPWLTALLLPDDAMLLTQLPVLLLLLSDLEPACIRALATLLAATKPVFVSTTELGTLNEAFVRLQSVVEAARNGLK